MMSASHEHFMSLANRVASESNCIRRSVGAVIVVDGLVITEGWNGVPGDYKDCREAGCPRCIQGGETGRGYDTCICIHAEQRAVSDAAKRGVSVKDSILYVNLRPCIQCLVIAKSSGVREVYYSGKDWNYSAEIEAAYRRLADQFDSFSRVPLLGQTVGADT